jgi:hypothetical protein
MVRKNYRALLITLAVMLTFACAPVFITPVAPPTLDPISLNTAIAQTAGAAATQTAVFQPPTSTLTFTPLPTRSPTEAPSSTPTFIFILPTNTVPTSTPTLNPTSSGSTSGCEVVSQDPENDTEFSPREDFDAHWVVRNTGDSTWDANSVDYRYVRGDALHQQEIYDLPNNVAAGRRIDLGVDMRAPNDEGEYSTTWQVRSGSRVLCSMRLTIIVR